MVTKSGVMVGSVSRWKNSSRCFAHLGQRGVDLLTVGQYLRPSKDHLPIARFYTPEEFHSMKQAALRFVFRHRGVRAAGAFSYHAHEQPSAFAALA